ncbi:MAG: hypothetical protein Q8P67_18645 [archaeon]|nr:hypothetical protein [archaeon]
MSWRPQHEQICPMQHPAALVAQHVAVPAPTNMFLKKKMERKKMEKRTTPSKEMKKLLYQKNGKNGACAER